MLTKSIFYQLVIMLAIALIGFIFSKTAKTTEVEQKFLSKMLLYFINPCVFLTSFNVEFEYSKFIALCLTIFLSFLITFITILFAEIIFRKKTFLNKLQKLGTVFTNCGFIGIPLITAVYGADGTFYLMGFIVAFNVFLWTYGFYQMSGKINLKKIITNPNILAIIIGLVLFCLPVKIPQIIAKPIAMIGSTNTAISMILLGLLFCDLKKEWIVKLAKTLVSFFTCRAEYENGRKKIVAILITSFVRLVVCSVLSVAFCVCVFYFVSKFFPAFDKDTLVLVASVVLIATLCPSAVSVTSFACIFDYDVVFANFLVCFTHVLCVFTIPFFLEVFLRLIV